MKKEESLSKGLWNYSDESGVDLSCDVQRAVRCGQTLVLYLQTEGTGLAK